MLPCQCVGLWCGPSTGKHSVSLIKVCSFGERRQNMSASAFKHCNMEKQGRFASGGPFSFFFCEKNVNLLESAG